MLVLAVAGGALLGLVLVGAAGPADAGLGGMNCFALAFLEEVAAVVVLAAINLDPSVCACCKMKHKMKQNVSYVS